MSSAADPTAAFLSALRGSGLLAPDQAADLARWAAAHRPDPTGVAKEISRRGWLTAFQIKEVFRGRGKDLTVDRYVLLDLLGEGGMGRVYKAHDTRLARDVALKIIRKERLSNPAAVARFGHEMIALGQLQHPNVVKAFDASQTGDTHFVVMEFIDGQDLTKIVRDHGPLSVPGACEAVRKAALGLHHAHEAGMVHRDIKPSNILVGRDGATVKLVDLGLARLDESAQEDARVTQEGYVIGTPDFLAPEQARNPAGVDIRADLYALGATLFYILTGRVPFDGSNPTEKLLRHCTEPPPPLRPLRPDAPPQLEHLIHWCMAKRPEDRPQTPMQLALALQPFCPQPRGTGAHPAAPPNPVPRPAPQPYPPPMPAPVPAPVPAPLPLPNPHSSSQVFKLPPRTNDDDPIRGRAGGGFPFALIGIGFGVLFVAAVLGLAAYRALLGGKLGPVEGFTNANGMKLVKLDGGTFRMGSPGGEPGRPDVLAGEVDPEGPVHEVTISGPFLMGAAEVTYGQYSRVMGEGPKGKVAAKRGSSASEHPVDGVTYEEAVEFCRKLTEKEKDQSHARPGWAYRLPTEAEWEYAARAGTATPFGLGPAGADRLVFRPQLKTALFTVTGMDPCEDADPADPSPIADKPARFAANAWGLYDMHGNVAEWCQDWYRVGYPADGPRTDPLGPPAGDRRVVRGGSFRDPASACRSAARKGIRPFTRPTDPTDPLTGTIGFRVVYAPLSK